MCVIRKYDGPRDLPSEVADPAATGNFCVVNAHDTFASDLKDIPILSSAAHDSDYNMHSHDEEQPRRHRGRPVKYQGDPNAPGLDAEERRQLLRRIANRESARRMRKRHLDELHDLSTEAKALQDNCNALTRELNMLKLRYGQAEEENRRISEELRIKKEKAEMWQTKNASLQREVCELTARMYEERERSLCLELCLKEMERKVGGRGSACAGPDPGIQAPGMLPETLGANYGATHQLVLPETTQQTQTLPEDLWLKKMAASIGSAPSVDSDMQFGCFPEVAGDDSAFATPLQLSSGESQESLDELIRSLGLLPKDALLEPMSA